MVGCGTTKARIATEQLLLSDAVDSTISKLDFSPLTGRKVFLDTTYVTAAGKFIPGSTLPANLVTSDYLISALRQQMTASGCMVVDDRNLADVICEARCGALGLDGHSVIYGIPANNVLANASSAITGAATLPTIPEIALVKREMNSAAAKVAIFAYEKETRDPIWQSGTLQAGSNAKDTWFFGVGPMQNGTIYGGSRFAGRRIRQATNSVDNTQAIVHSADVDHRSGHVFTKPAPEKVTNVAENPTGGATGTPAIPVSTSQ